MEESVYKVITLIGSSPESWEKAASAAVEQAGKTLKDMRIARVEELDMHLADGKVLVYRARLRVSFKYHPKVE
jgi:flavin-binding protein dodecin